MAVVVIYGGTKYDGLCVLRSVDYLPTTFVPSIPRISSALRVRL